MPHLPRIPRPEVPADHEQDFENHICPPTRGGGPLDVIPGEVPDQRLSRDLSRDFDLLLPLEVQQIVDARNGGTNPALPMWIIADDDDDANGRQFPSKPIRTKVGDIIYADVGFHRNTHTIHWHGIEPGSGNDGVGKHSWEISGNFTYRFQTNSPGTFFYHCHKNTTLHFEMGLYGALIVDPNVPGAPFPIGGPGRYPSVAAAGLPLDSAGTFGYDVEQIWAVDEMDSRWHLELESDHDAFMQNCDGRMRAGSFTQNGFLHDFRPDVFTIGAVVSVPSAPGSTVGNLITDPRAAIFASPGQVVLLRIICASYIIQEFVLPLPATVVGMDGHPLGVPPFDQYSFPFTQPAGEGGRFRLTSARRRDLVFQPSAANTGDHEIIIRYRHAIDLRVLHEARVLFRVNGDVEPPPVANFQATARYNPNSGRLQVRTTPAQANAPFQVFAGLTQVANGTLDARGRFNANIGRNLAPTRIVITVNGIGFEFPVTR